MEKRRRSYLKQINPATDGEEEEEEEDNDDGRSTPVPGDDMRHGGEGASIAHVVKSDKDKDKEEDTVDEDEDEEKTQDLGSIEVRWW